MARSRGTVLSTSPPTPAPQENGMMRSRDLAELALSFQKSRIFLTAYELGIFTAVGRKSRSSHQVSDKLGTAKRHTDRLMNALCALGLLKKTGNRFRNTHLSLTYLVGDSPGFMKGIMHNVHMWDAWSALTETVRSGRPAARRSMNERGRGWLEPFIAAMHERAVQNASAVVGSLDLSGVSKVLDVGGGSGAYAMAFARARKRIAATVFDLPNVIGLTRKYIREEGLSDRVKLVAGDYNIDDLGGAYDLIFLSAIIHSNSFGQNRILIKKAAHALRSGGRIVIQDFIMDEGRMNPSFGAFFALNMLVATDSGDTYTESEVRAWLEEAGFTDIKRKDTEFGTALIIGRRSAAGPFPGKKENRIQKP